MAENSIYKERFGDNFLSFLLKLFLVQIFFVLLQKYMASVSPLLLGFFFEDWVVKYANSVIVAISPNFYDPQSLPFSQREQKRAHHLRFRGKKWLYSVLY